MRESGGRGQGPGRGTGGAGSQGGPGAARRTQGGPGRAGRQGGGSSRSDGTGRPSSPDTPPRRPPERFDPFDLPFGRDAADRGKRPQDPADEGRGRPRDDDARRGGSGGSRRGAGDDARPRSDTNGRASKRPNDDRAKGRPAQGRDSGERSRGRAPQGRDGAEKPPGRAGRDGDGSSGRGRQGRDSGSPPRGSGSSARGAAPRGREDGPVRRTGTGASAPRAGSTPGSRTGAREQTPGQRPGERQASTASRQRAGARQEGHEPRRRGGDVPPPRGPGRPPRPPRPPKPPLMLRLGNPRRRINLGIIGMTFVLSIFAGRLIQMQGLDSKVYEAAATRQRQHVAEIPARRGSITDVNGHELAVTVEARELSIDPTKVPAASRPAVARVLAQQLGKSEQDIAAKLAKTDTRYQLLARDVDPVVSTRLLQAGIPSLSAEKTYRRLYPAGDLAGSLIGFVGDEGTGLGGMEQMQNSVLAGRDGEQRVETGRDGQRIPMTSSQREAPVDGRDIRLTIDRDIQWAAQKSIADQVRASGADSGAVIVMDVQTARIVAMANAPELDLNDWRKAPASSYVNKATAEVFEPGSTNKVITAAAALEAGAVTPDTVYRVPDSIRCADRVLRDAHAHKVESMTFREAMAQSSNVATIMAARKIGSGRLYQMLKAFGFGTRPGGGLPNAEAGLLPDYRKWSGSQNCTVAYGQGVSVTALQMASVYQTIANGGVKIEPQIVAGATDGSGRFVPAPAGKQTRVVSETTAKEITTMLESAVGAEGTGQLAAIPGYRVAGKTGTADRYDADLGRYNGYTASFVGFAPADKPRLVVLSVVQNPRKGHFGGQLAAPVFKDVMTFAIKSRKIPPTGSDAPPVRARAGQ
ncbi:penicillin-binding transpeptidase domain-containing protein [Nonomuraea maritima]|uniref:penicillin-binding transpeptidase domain-containing protein n=1 Tax=Nonomuraea maritima TaxID=683260 RepID=UPI00370F8C8A